MNYLLDTCVISELTRRTPDVQVVSWIREQDPRSLYLSYLTIGELWKGIVKRGADTRAKRLERWLLNDILKAYTDRILPVDDSVAFVWGDVCGSEERVGKKFPVVDSLIAATALARRMTLVTRNVNDVTGTGVLIMNPFGDN